MASAAFGLFCLVGGFVGLGILVGWLAWGRNASPRRPSAGPDNSTWLTQQVDREPLRSILTDDQRAEIRDLYGRAPGQAQVAPTTSATATSEASGDSAALTDVLPGPYLTDSPSGPERPPSPLASPEESARPAARPARDPLDPAALLLYVGAFLIGAAGVVYSAYNWADLEAWQKLGMLGLLTAVFGGVGWSLLGNRRLRQAGETFVAIAAMLIPANAIAVWTVSQQTTASTGLIVLVGAAITTLVHGTFSIRPGGKAYAYGTAVFGWLTLGAIPAAVGLPWPWGGPLVVLAVGLSRYLESRTPAVLTHLQRPIRQTGIIALVLTYVAMSPAIPDASGWLAVATFGAYTVTFCLVASLSRGSIWSVLASIGGLVTLFRLLAEIDGEDEWLDRPWLAVPLLLAASVVLIGLGERGPAWLRRWGSRLALQVEAVIVLVVAAAASGGDRWLLVVVAAAAVALTGAIARLRDDRWVLLLTGGAILALGLSLADAIDRIDDWPTIAILALLTVLVALLATSGWLLDRWAARTERVSWGMPLWLIAGITAIWANLVVLSADDLDPGQSIWGWLAGANLLFTVLSFVAAGSTSTATIRIIAGVWMVGTAIAVAAWPDLRQIDRLPVVLLVLIGLIVGQTMVTRRLDRSPGTNAGYERILPGCASLLVLAGMVTLAVGWLVDPNLEIRGEIVSARWTWVSYATTFGAIGLAAGWRSLHPRETELGGRTLKAASVGATATGISAGFLTLTAILVTSMATDRAGALVVTIVLVSWAVHSLAATFGSRLSTATAWRLTGLVIAGLAVPWSAALPEFGDELSRATWLTITLVSLAGMLAVEGWLRRQRLLLTAASGLAMAALLIQIDAQEPANILAYSLPLGVYLLALGTANRKIPAQRDLMLGAGSGVLLVPALWLAQQEGAVGFLLLAAGIALGLFLGGILLRLRVPIAAGILGLTVIVLRLLVDAVLALESWLALLVVGLVLIGAGTAALVWQEALRARLERLQRGWHDLG